MSRVRASMLASMAALLTVGPVVHSAGRSSMGGFSVDKSTRLKPPTPKPYLGQTPEQRAWNQAVDARKAEKKAGHR